MSAIEFCSFRDPSGSVIKYGHRILRLIKKGHEESVAKTIGNPVIQNFIQSRVVPETRFITGSDFRVLAKDLASIAQLDLSDISLCIEHERIPFPSYPSEWAPEMLHCAAEFTLDLCLRLLDQHICLKDATPYNILFRGPHPVFVDILSFEAREPADPIWIPYAQFVRSFLLPLLANRESQVDLSQIFLNKLDGLEPEEMYQIIQGIKRLKPGVFSLVTVPTLLSKLLRRSQNAPKIYQKKPANSPAVAAFILKRIFKGLKKQLDRLAPKPKSSHWTDYFVKEESYSKEEFKIKEKIVQAFLEEARPKTLLDIGCNTGHFSIFGAKRNASVVAIDSDPAVVGALWREARKNSLDILPLVVDICRPTPALGWNNSEYLSFLTRSYGTFDTVLMLAVLHHIAVTARIPFENIAKMCSEITTNHLIIEYIPPQDPMFRMLVRGRDELYSHLTQEYFEKIWGQKFRLKNKQLSGKYRWIYLFEKK